MKQYEKYKQSGVEWIGEIPEHWEVMPLKRYGSMNKGLTFTKEDLTEEGAPVISYGQVHAKFNSGTSIHKDLIRKIPFSLAENRDDSLVSKGQFIIADTSEDYEGCGNCVYNDCDIPLYGGYHTIVYKPKGKDNKFLAYLFKTDRWRSQIRAKVSGVKVFSITQGILSQVSTIIPPLPEQTAIANFLDYETAKIDKTIATRQRQIELLKELKSSVISQAVTKGINPNAKMKNSGVEWIGEIPEHWEVIKMRYLCSIKTGTKDTINKVDDGAYPFYVRSPKIEKINSYSYDGEAILMAGDGVGAGKVFHYVKGKFDYHQRVYNFHKIRKVKPILLFYFLKEMFTNKIEEGGAKNTVDSVRLIMIQDFPVCVAPLPEQQQIVSYIEERTAKIDTAIGKYQQQIDLLKEYRASLITEAATGKIDVRDFKSEKL